MYKYVTCLYQYKRLFFRSKKLIIEIIYSAGGE